ncbi:hypothetical protein CERSUDRAFT_82338 [Gelatoporia subvermispora B]|uniref:Calcineurin-like phosphoesterase domain-containing protein n=1 Tax=Ceriporiopsis subvermispora (strain B) TaxID=914234 RepID=M2RI01_CERS8|nr:hypothetical protein CERSUDRAFT_82338 [Gelatoporia subvermispora B]
MNNTRMRLPSILDRMRLSSSSQMPVGDGSPVLSSPTASVCLSYDVNNPPPHPGPSWTRFVCISDTHSRTLPVPPGDVLLHAGDLSSWGMLAHLQVTLDWLQTLPHPAKILIAGNHDISLDEEWRPGGVWEQKAGQGFVSQDVDAALAVFRSQQLRDAGIYYLDHESLQIVTDNGRKWEIYGSPSAPRYAVGAFQYETKEEANTIYDAIPSSTEILLTHTPPYGICDVTRKGKQAGCKALAKKLQSKDLRNCRLHIFGHIHEAHGAVVGKTDGKYRASVNAAMHTGKQAVIVDLKN